MKKLLLLLLLSVPLASSSTGTDSQEDESQEDDSRRRFSRHNFSSQYWTAYLNVSYVDEERKVWHTERTETGRFAGTGPVAREAVGGVAVRLIPVSSDSDGEDVEDEEDDSGCVGPFRPDWPDPSQERWVAVVRRGGCTFNTKISNAVALNASAVLVYDNEARDALQSMRVERFPVPSVLTYAWKGEELVRLMKKVGRVYVSLQEASHCVAFAGGSGDRASQPVLCTLPEDRRLLDSFFGPGNGGLGSVVRSPFWQWNATSGHGVGGGGGGEDAFSVEKRTSVLFVSVSFIVLMVVSLAWLIFYYVQRFRYLHAKDRLERRLCSQAKRALSIISTSVLRRDDLEMRDFSETCAVCIETYKVDDVVRILPCRHQFHKSCIDQWLLEKRTCPMCKMDILKHYGLAAASSSSSHSSSAPSQAGEEEEGARRGGRHNQVALVRNEVEEEEEEEEVDEERQRTDPLVPPIV